MDFHKVENIQEKQLNTSSHIDELTQKANYYLNDNNLGKAYPFIKKLTQEAEVSADILNTAALVAISLSKNKEASNYFKKAIEQEPEHFDVNYNFALFEINNQHFGNAKNILTRLIEYNPDNENLYNDIALVYMKMNQISSAMENWQKALSLNPNLALARNNALEYCLKNKKFEEGKHLLRFNSQLKGITPQSVEEIKNWQSSLRNSERKDMIITEGSQIS